MSIRRVAVIFDNDARPETTGFYCRALGSLVEVEHFTPSELQSIDPGAFDLFLNIDDGMRYHLPDNLRPSAYWAIDTHIDFDWSVEKAQRFDFVFAAQRNGTAHLQESGISHAQWLPLAADPEIHRFRPELEADFDLTFVGNVIPGPRAELMSELQSVYPDMFIGRKYFSEMADVYSQSRIAFNRSVKDDINMRVFEVPSCGPLLVTNNLSENGLDELFVPGEEIVVYESPEELLDRIDYFLKHERDRRRIARRGRSRVIAEHTYRLRMEQILRHVESALSTRVAGTGKVGNGPVKPEWYYGFERPEVVNLVPAEARTILDIGCGGGSLGKLLKERQTAVVVGCELDEHAAERASDVLDRVVVGNIENVNECDFDADSFDCVVCADVLEHLRDPAAALRRIHGWLKPDGQVVLSLPNARHHSVVTSLLAGNWTYEAAGLLDDDHVRFFTRREIEKLLFRCGFEIEHREGVPGSGYGEWVESGKLGEVSLNGLQMSGLSSEDAEEFFTYQYLVRARRQRILDHGLTSIIIVTHNQIAYTQQCINSILMRTDEPFELILVDNGSDDGTVEYLETIPNATLIRNPDNRGFPAAVNQGLERARGDYFLLLNNDCIVTTGWLNRLLRVFESHSDVGLAGPVSNNISGPQQIAATYETLENLDGFAWDWGKANAGIIENEDRLVGFCLMIRRGVVEEIGTFDERFGIGCFEDDDFCRRAVAAGYRNVIAREVFVHHFGSRTFLGSKVDIGAILDANARIYEDKWGGIDPSPIGRIETAESVDTISGDSNQAAGTNPFYAVMAPDRSLLLRRHDVTISLCMIVRNNENTIQPCLESIRPWVDEMIVVDTGSTDRTPEIARKLGAKVSFFPWCDDFSAARNASLEQAVGEWIFWMDSDDTISEDCGRRLAELAHQPVPKDVFGYVVQVHCPGADDSEHDVTVVDHVKLFRNFPQLRFEGRIHEQIIPAIRRAGGDVAWTDLHVVHSGADHTPDGRAGKLERDFRILRLEYEDNPDHPFVLFNLGMTHADAGEHKEAVRFLNRCLKVSSVDESHVRKAYALYVSSLSQLQRNDEAFAACQEGLDRFPGDPELLFRSGLLHHLASRLNEAVDAYLSILNGEHERHYTSVDQGILGFKARHNLALVYEDLQQFDDADAQWQTIVDERPTYSVAWRGLGESLLKQGRIQEVRIVAGNLLEEPHTESVGLLLKARSLELDGDISSAIQILDQQYDKEIENLDIHRELGRLYFESGQFALAIPVLGRLTELAPDDAASFHNLGIAFLHQEMLSDAIVSLEESVSLRPDSTDTLIHLAHAYQSLGRAEFEERSWKQVLQLCPDHEDARKALQRLSKV